MVSIKGEGRRDLPSLDVAKVVEKWGVLPTQVPHVQAICGDAIDGSMYTTRIELAQFVNLCSNFHLQLMVCPAMVRSELPS